MNRDAMSKRRTSYMLMKKRAMIMELNRLKKLQQKLKNGEALILEDGTIITIPKKG